MATTPGDGSSDRTLGHGEPPRVVQVPLYNDAAMGHGYRGPNGITTVVGNDDPIDRRLQERQLRVNTRANTQANRNMYAGTRNILADGY